MVAAWVIGVLLAIGAALAAAIGDNLVKRACLDRAQELKRRDAGNRRELQHLGATEPGNGQDHDESQANLLGTDEEDAEDVKALWQRPTWILGIFCMVVLNAGMTVASFAFVDASMTIPFGGLHICFNIPLARYINGERFSLRAIMFNGIILAGVMVVLLFGNHGSRTFTAEELVEIAAAPGFIVASCVMIGITQTFAKAMSECIKDGAWIMPITYVCILLTIGSALFQVIFLNKCLDRYPAFFVVPLVNSTIIIVGSVYAAIYFQEVNRWTLESRICVPIGIFLTGVGIFLLSFAESEKELEQAFSSDDDEDEENVNDHHGRHGDVEHGHDGQRHEQLDETSSLMRPLTGNANRGGYDSLE
ncbi:Magnesium transporter NIPA2 [Hondaea fermentalgiana]|uniref:Magnesium transporter NIPA2 n=1 Tax=Hondaea fermentalgiana TaxID=2315210 RepID=A0A2R5GHK3_9STRA|nr:Magnesium transporter NIPA2 [Hondaea fermentalgiana]|eukprot:GBG30065.1 Magnesium transporter NIPA2 [Hondaea fermentalgiana]